MKLFKRVLATAMAGVMALSLAALPEMPFDFQSVVSVSAETVTGTYGDLTYEIIDGKVTVTHCYYPDISVEIPAEIEGYPVTRVASRAFNLCTGLTLVTIPDSVENIEGGAFYACSSLFAVSVDENNPYYSDIDGVLFNIDKSELIHYPSGRTEESYVIPDSVSCIKGYAFNSCLNLNSVTIPDSVANIENRGFYVCYSLTCISVNENNSGYSDIDGILFNKDKSELINYPAGRAENSYIIPDSVATIEEFAFCQCSALTSVTIPESVTSLKSGAFSRCSGLTSIIIPDSVISIGEAAFFVCYGLTSIVIPDTVRSIGAAAFIGCPSVVSVTIPTTVTSIGEKAFGYSYDYTGDWRGFKLDNFTISGYPNTAAEAYAIENGFTFIPLTEQPALTLGDPNGDGEITVRDALLILEFAAEIRTFTEEQAIVADVDGNGMVTPYDALLILMYEAEMITEFPASSI